MAPARGNEKGRVERSIRYIRDSFFAGRQFTGLDDLNAQARAWCLGTAADRRWVEDSTLSVRQAFEAEGAKLLALPSNEFALGERVAVTVDKTPYIRFDLNDYSVPHTHVRRTLAMLADEWTVRRGIVTVATIDDLTDSSTALLRLSYSSTRGTPAKVTKARAWPRRKLSIRASRKKRRKTMGLWLSTITKAMFEDERVHLQRLPLTGMQYFKQEQRTVCDDGCVRVDHSSYSARPVAIGAKVLVRLFERRIEIGELATGHLVRTHERAERPGTVVMPQAERVFNPSRETRFILKQADQIGPHAARLCRMLFGIEGRVGQRKLHGIVNLSRRYPSRFVDAACAAAIEQGIHSYKHVKALTERLVAEALAAIDAAGDGADPGRADLAQEHALIRDTEEYGSLFNLAATQAGVDTSVGGGL